MRRAALPLACLLLLFASAAPADAATKKERQRVCAKRGVTYASSQAARVFEVGQDDRSLYGCMRSNGRLQLLSRWYSCDCSVGDEIAPDAELHAGRFAEVTEYESCGPLPEPTCGGSSAALRDLRARRWYPVQDDVAEVVARGGTFAYADGRVVLVQQRVATVADAAAGSDLALGRTRLYWTRDGLPQSAPLQ